MLRLGVFYPRRRLQLGVMASRTPLFGLEGGLGEESDALSPSWTPKWLKRGVKGGSRDDFLSGKTIKHPYVDNFDGLRAMFDGLRAMFDG